MYIYTANTIKLQNCTNSNVTLHNYCILLGARQTQNLSAGTGLHTLHLGVFETNICTMTKISASEISNTFSHSRINELKISHRFNQTSPQLFHSQNCMHSTTVSMALYNCTSTTAGMSIGSPQVLRVPQGQHGHIGIDVGTHTTINCTYYN